MEGPGGTSSKANGETRRTIVCFLCGGTQIYPGPRYENHLLNEHGVVFDTEFIIKLSLFKRDHGNLPNIENFGKAEPVVNGHLEDLKTNIKKEKKESSDCISVSTQTESSEEENLCTKCQGPLAHDQNGHLDNGNLLEDDSDEEPSDFEGLTDWGCDVEDVDSPTKSSQEMDTSTELLQAWQCPLCPKIFKRHTHFKQHACLVHEMDKEDIEGISAVMMSKEDIAKQEDTAKNLENKGSSQSRAFQLDKSKRKPMGKEWAPNSFSSLFTCYFCNEQFRKDYKLKLHLMLNHKNESPADMSKAKEELTKSKLDGCVHKCAMCGSKYNSVANFTRHIKDVHMMTRAQYREEYGSSEVISRMFKCELCDKEVKHTRNIIGAHMKMVHLISWKEYQDILIRLRQGETVGDLPAPEMFDCVICGVSVKYKREHLNKKHMITEDVYDELIAKKNRGEDISDAVPQREIFKCVICERECLDLKKHIERSHQITEEMYEEIGCSKGPFDANNPDALFKPIKFEESSVASVSKTSSKKKASNSGDTFKSKSKKNSVELTAPSPPCSDGGTAAGALSTDLQCYFGCDEFFKKDFQLYLHLKLRHRNEDPAELQKAYEAAEEEIALTRRSGSTYQCALCSRQFNDSGAFYSHIQTRHNMQWREYKDKYGRCEIESSPFECKICNRVIKYDRNTVHTHLKNVHGINWAMYIDRIRKLRRGEEPDELPTIEFTECKVCNLNVKYLRDHLKNAHKITEEEYKSLFEDDENDHQLLVPAQTLTVKDEHPVVISSQSIAPIPLAKPPKSDIQDKTNKRCSSCNITFDSRRSFIEHCTTIHNMKFKTKSGMTISAPSIPRQQPHQTLQQAQKQPQTNQKRKLSSEAHSTPRFDRPPPLKRFKPKFMPDYVNELDQHDTNSNGEMTPKSQATNSASKWNQCRYECCFCKKTTMSRSSMTSHIHHTHGIPIKDYKEANYPDIEVETNWFQCRLCSAKTKFVKDCIAPHLKMSHNIDIDIYEAQFMQPEDWPQVSGPRSTMRIAESKRPRISGSPTEVEVPFEKEDKWNKCKYRCSLCQWTSIDSRQMRAHIATTHGLSHDQYVRQYGTTEIVSKRFKCLLCKSEMKHCRQNIYAHMKDVHKMSLASYEERVGSEGLEESAIVEPELVKPELSKKSSNIAQSVMNPQDNVIPNLLDNGQPPSRWNRCRFQCALCLKLSSEKRHIREHVVRAHGISMNDYESQFGDCEIHTEYFFCGVCHAEVKHNLKNISLHLQNVHKISPIDYEKQYGRLSDEPVMIPGLELPSEDGLVMQEADMNILNASDSVGFGSHFLTMEDEAVVPNQSQSRQPSSKLPNSGPPPPKSEVTNPKCKFCSTCNKDFNRRQAFLEHCRNVHNMKIKFAGSSNLKKKMSLGGSPTESNTSQSQLETVSPASSGRAEIGRHTCEFCGKEFSNRSNRNRHMILSCEVKKSGGVSDGPEVNTTDASNQFETDSDKYSSGLHSPREPQRCPFPDCKMVHERTALMKRHLFEVHNIQNVSISLSDLEVEKKKEKELLESKHTHSVDDDDNEDGEDTPIEYEKPVVNDRLKVPPIRVRLSGLSPPQIKTAKSIKSHTVEQKMPQVDESQKVDDSMHESEIEDGEQSQIEREEGFEVEAEGEEEEEEEGEVGGEGEEEEVRGEGEEIGAVEEEEEEEDGEAKEEGGIDGEEEEETDSLSTAAQEDQEASQDNCVLTEAEVEKEGEIEESAITVEDGAEQDESNDINADDEANLSIKVNPLDASDEHQEVKETVVSNAGVTQNSHGNESLENNESKSSS